MRIAGIIVGFVIALMGAVWVLQGLNSTLVPQSFMTDNRIWVVIGAVAVFGGLAVAKWNWQHR